MPTGEHILIVEDETDVVDLVAGILGAEGYVCEVARDGKSGLAQAQLSLPDLIILDRGLPCFTGDDVLRELRRHPLTRNVPVILLTGKADESDQLVGFALGADDYVCKPFSPKLLRARVESLLRRTGAAVAADIRPTLHPEPITLNRTKRAAYIGEKTVSLSDIEYRILATLMAARGHVLDGETLIGLAIDNESDKDAPRIEPHIAALQRKLGPASKCIQKVHGAGYAFCEPNAVSPAP